MADKIYQIITVVERGFANKVTEVYRDRGVKLHHICSGRGSASSDIMERLGIGSSEKDIVFSYASGLGMERLVKSLSGNQGRNIGCRGIVIMQKLNAMNKLVVSALMAEDKDKEEIHAEVTQIVNNTLILVTVNHGYTDDIMDCARANGATGGTIMRARFVGAEHIEQVHGLSVQEEKEMLMLVVDSAKRNSIMEAINDKFGMKSEAQAMICAMPVEKAMLLS